MPNLQLKTNQQHRINSQSTNQNPTKIQQKLNHAITRISSTSQSLEAGLANSSSRNLSNAGKFLLGMMLFSSLKTAETLEGGKINNNPDVNELVPNLGRTSRCTGGVLSPHKVITAGHCSNPPRLLNGIYEPPSHVSIPPVPQTTADIKILNYPTAKQSALCMPPIMTPQTLNNLMAVQHTNPCGVKGSVIVMGRGLESSAPGSRSGELKAGLFTIIRNNPNRATIKVQGVADGATPKPYTHNGDSGGITFACNPQTQKFELLGVHSSSARGNNPSSTEVSISKNTQVESWLTNNKGHCVGREPLGYELYPSSDHLPINKPEPKTCAKQKATIVKATGQHGLKLINNCPGKVEFNIKEVNVQKPKIYKQKLSEGETKSINVRRVTHSITKTYVTT
ncbi:MAG: trypsin-like serine protease [Shewanella sp.]